MRKHRHYPRRAAKAGAAGEEKTGKVEGAMTRRELLLLGLGIGGTLAGCRRPVPPRRRRPEADRVRLGRTGHDVLAGTSPRMEQSPFGLMCLSRQLPGCPRGAWALPAGAWARAPSASGARARARQLSTPFQRFHDNFSPIQHDPAMWIGSGILGGLGMPAWPRSGPAGKGPGDLSTSSIRGALFSYPKQRDAGTNPGRLRVQGPAARPCADGGVQHGYPGLRSS